MRRLLLGVVLVLAWAGSVSAQRTTETLTRAAMTNGAERCTAPVLIEETDGRIDMVADLSDAQRLDPARRFRIEAEASRNQAGPWQRIASATTWGSALRVPGVPPSISISAPAATFWARTCLRAEANVNAGVALRVWTGTRALETRSDHHSVAYDAFVAVTGASVGSLTSASFTVGSNANRHCTMFVRSNQTGINTTATTCATASGSSVGTRTENGTQYIHAWHTIAPSSGSQTASATFSDTWATVLALVAVTTDDVDQTTPVSDLTGATGTGTAIAVSVPNTVSGGMQLTAALGGGGGTMTAAAPQTVVYNPGAGGALYVSRQDGADGGDMEYTGQFSAAWIQVGVRLVEDTSGGSTCTGGLTLLGAGKCD